MNVEDLRAYCLTLRGVEESFPFDENSLVMKVGGKMFALIPLENEEPRIALKCNPELAIELRERYESVQPAYHFNKKHWNSVFLTSEITAKQIKEWIDHSYLLVFDALPKKIKEEI